jgi:Protein of unknown function (DUF3313)
MHDQESSRRIQQNIDCITRQPQKSHIERGTSLRKFIYPSLLAAGSLVLAGFATHAQDLTKKQEQIASQSSGFLANYGRLQPDSKNPDLLIYMRNPSELKTSTKFIIDPVVIYLLPQAEQRALDPGDLDELAQTFTKAIKDELTASGAYEVVTDPGPGVMELRLAITNVEPTGAKKNAALKGAATAASVALAPGASLLVPRLSVGRVAIEGEILDSTSGQVQVSFMTSKAGRRYFSGLKQFQTWGDIRAAFKSWAKGFRKRVDQAHES